jgi:hypothetical protein
MRERLRLACAAFGALTAMTMAAAHAESVPEEGLKVGNDVVLWGEKNGTRTLTYGGKILAWGPDAGMTPVFEILDRWDDADTSAVLLQSGVAATLKCAGLYVIESRKPGSVVGHSLGFLCVSMTPATVRRTEEGFVASGAPAPTWSAPAQHWQARTGKVVATTVDWHPAAGTTMAAFVERPAADLAEPLETAEFFAAVSRLPKLEQERAVTALWQVANGCPGCGGSAVKERYGVAIDARTAAFSGCGWYLYGAWLECGPADALAVWDRASGAFYFATDVHKRDGIHLGLETLTVTPPVERWPAAAKDRFEAWRNGWPWPSIGR